MRIDLREAGEWGAFFRERIGVDYPIVQGPMNGASPVGLVVSVSQAGGLGSLAAALLDPGTIVAKVAEIRRGTSKPFAVNLFVNRAPEISHDHLDTALARLEPAMATLGLKREPAPLRFCEDFDQQVEALLEAGPPIVSFTFGIVPRETVDRFHEKGILVIGTATNVTEALAWESVGADAICAQGIEAGGHRATFLGDFEQSGIGLMALIPQVRQAVSVPIIAAGGIADGRSVAAALVLGADAAQLGTAFLVSPEAGIAKPWLNAVLNSKSDSTRLTRSFSGRLARGIVNDFMEQMRPYEAEFPPYPVQNALTAELRRTATESGNSGYMSLWAGQASPLVRTMPAGQLVQKLVSELRNLGYAR